MLSSLTLRTTKLTPAPDQIHMFTAPTRLRTLAAFVGAATIAACSSDTFTAPQRSVAPTTASSHDVEPPDPFIFACVTTGVPGSYPVHYSITGGGPMVNVFA